MPEGDLYTASMSAAAPEKHEPIPFNDTRRLYQAFADEMDAAVSRTLRSGWWSGGPQVEAFASEFARHLGVQFCLPVANGTDALELAMKALKLTGRALGSEVVTVANAGGYTVTACGLAGYVPVFADVVAETQLIDPQSVIASLSEDTAIVVVTHLYGGVVDVPALRKRIDAAGFQDVPILEDCAQAHGGRLGDRRVGSLGDIATFSFYPTKNLGAVGDAGAVATSDPHLFSAVRRLHQYGWVEKYRVSVAGGRNSRLDEIQAAVLLVLLPHLDELNARRKDILQAYAMANVKLPIVLSRSTDCVAHLAVLLCEDRQNFRDHMAQRGIATDVHYPILDCDQAGCAGLPHRIGPAGLPVSRRSVDRIVSVPCFPSMTDGEVERVVEAIAGWSLP
jgi:dTDP-4-amino-4,6-dideoxygalactose transaminase